MTSAHPIKNTSKPYVCTSCGAEHVSVIREDPKGINPRLKCNNCQFVFNGEDSLAAQEAGIIQSSSAETLASASEPEVEHIVPREVRTNKLMDEARQPSPIALNRPGVPNRPAYVFITKDGQVLFSNKSEFKRNAIRWSDRAFSVYELKPVKLTVDVNVMDH